MEAIAAAKFLAETFDATGGINEFLLAGEERMALAADVDADTRLSAAGGERISTGAMYGTSLVLRMGIGFHVKTPDRQSCVEHNSTSVDDKIRA